MANVLEAAGVTKRFGTFTVLDGVNFTLAQREAVGIVGPNGAGKTTLLNVLSGAYVPNAGTITFGERDVSRLDAAERNRRGIARSHQVPRPFADMTVFENVYVAATQGGGQRGAEAYAASTAALELCGMMRVANRTAASLGLLDRKRLELARALGSGPRVLLLDEIGAGLTDAEASQLIAIIREVRSAGIAIVWIEHIMHVLLQVVERLICMDAGRVIADGIPEKVLNDAAVVQAYLGRSIA